MTEHPMEGFPLDAGWLDELHGQIKDYAHELLGEFTVGSLWVGHAARDEADSMEQESAMLLLALAHTMCDAHLRIAQIESAKVGRGIDMDVVLTVGRSVYSALLLAGVRFGQRHPEAFGGTVPIQDVDLLMAAVQDLLKGGEAEDPE